MCLGKSSCTNVNTGNGMQGSSIELVLCGISHSSKHKLCDNFIYCVVDVICFSKNECLVPLIGK